jgi:hypothetical protein
MPFDPSIQLNPADTRVEVNHDTGEVRIEKDYVYDTPQPVGVPDCCGIQGKCTGITFTASGLTLSPAPTEPPPLRA